MPQQITPTLFIGLGGTGHLFISNLKQIITKEFLNGTAPFPLIKYLVVDSEFISIPHMTKSVLLSDDERKAADTFRASMEDASYETSIKSCIAYDEQVEIQLSIDDVTRYMLHPELLGIEDFMPSNIAEIRPGSFGAGQIGLLGKIMGISFFQDIYKKIDTAIGYFYGNQIDTDVSRHWGNRYNRNMQQQRIPLSVYIVCSLGGGTGRGLHLLVAGMARHALNRVLRNPDDGKITLINFAPDCFDVAGRRVPRSTLSNLNANQYAGFKELDYIFQNMSTGQEGYIEVEDYFKSNLGDPNLESHQLYNGAYVISSKLDGAGGITMDNYKMINDITARAFAAMTFNGYQGEIEGTLGNPDQFQPILEAETGVRRVRRYGRIGRGMLYYPVERIIQYIETYVCYKSTLDLLDGNLTAPSSEHSTNKARKKTSTIFERIKIGENLDADVKNSTVLRENNFDADYSGLLQEQFRNKSNFLSANADALSEQLVNTKRAAAPDYLKEVQASIDSEIIREIESNGIHYALGYLDAIMGDIAGYWKKVIEDHTSKKVSSTSRLEFSGNLTKKIDELKTAANPYFDGTHALYDKLRDSLTGDRKTWEKKRNILHRIGVVESPSPVISPDTKKIVQQIIVEFNSSISEPLRWVFSMKISLGFLTEFEKYILTTIENLQKSKQVIHSLGKTSSEPPSGLLQEFKDAISKIASTPVDSTIVYAFGETSKDYEDLETLPRLSGIYETVQDELNNKVVPDILAGTLKKKKLEELLREKTAEEVKREFVEGANPLTISNYLRYLVNQGKHDIVESLWEKLHHRASWLGTINDRRVGARDQENAPFFTKEFLEIEDPELFKNSQASRADYYRHVSVNTNDQLRDRCILTRYHITLPLFVFDSIFEAQKDYDILARREASPEGAAAVMAKYHTAKRFFFVDEPLGKILHIPSSELEDTLNLMLHMGVFRVDKEGYLSCLQKELGSTRSKMKKWLADKADDHTGVFFINFYEEVEKHNELMVHLLNQTTNLLGRLAVPAFAATKTAKDECVSAFKAYLTDPKYPLIPETFLQNRLMKEDKIKALFKHKALQEGYKKKLKAHLRDNPEPTLYMTLDSMLEEKKFKRHRIIEHLGEVMSGDLSHSEDEESIGVADSKSTKKSSKSTEKATKVPSKEKKRKKSGVKDNPLKKLLDYQQELFEKGVISEEEYKEARMKALTTI